MSTEEQERTEKRLCDRCLTAPAAGYCCSSHLKGLCHRCYRTTHFVEVCVSGCSACAAEGLPPVLGRATPPPGGEGE